MLRTSTQKKLPTAKNESIWLVKKGKFYSIIMNATNFVDKKCCERCMGTCNKPTWSDRDGPPPQI